MSKKQMKKTKKANKKANKKEEKKNWPTMQDIRRYSAWLGMVLMMVAIIISFWSSVLLLTGFALLLAAFEEKIRKKMKQVKK